MKKHRYTREQLEPIVKECSTMAEVCRRVGIIPATGSQSHIRKRILSFGLDVSHFIGHGWSKDKKFGPKHTIEDYLSNKVGISSHRLKLRLFEEGLKDKICEHCGLSEWMGEEIVFELDHINSDHFDNALKNLMILCPNCHALKTRNGIL